MTKTTYTAEAFKASPAFLKIAIEDAVKVVAKTNGQTEALTMQALSMGVPNVVEAVCKLVNAAAEHCAKEANAGTLWSTK
jgi:hypothetical protein